MTFEQWWKQAPKIGRLEEAADAKPYCEMVWQAAEQAQREKDALIAEQECIWEFRSIGRDIAEKIKYQGDK
jgi:hypothetical protein